MSVMKVLIETEQFLEWLKTKYLPTWETTFEFLTAKLLEKCPSARKEITIFKANNEMNRRKFAKDVEEAMMFIQIAKKEPGKENISNVYKRLESTLTMLRFDSVSLQDFKKTLSRNYFDLERVFLESRDLIYPVNNYYSYVGRKIINKLKASIKQKRGVFERLAKGGFLSYFNNLKVNETLKIAGKKVTLKIYAPPILRKIKITDEKEEVKEKKFTYKELLLSLINENIKFLKDEEKKELYLVYLEEIKEKTNNEIILEVAYYVRELSKFVLETNPQYILSDNFEINIRIQDLGDKGFSATCHNNFCTDNSAYIEFNMWFLLGKVSINYDFFQHRYYFADKVLGDTVITLAHELTHAKDFHSINFGKRLVNQLQEQLNLRHVLPQTVKAFRLFTGARDEAITQISEIFTKSEYEKERKRPFYFVSQHFQSKLIYKEGFNKLIEDLKNSLELIREVDLDENGLEKITVLQYPLARHCVFMIFLYFYFTSKQVKIVTLDKDFKEINAALKKQLTNLAENNEKRYMQLQIELILTPEKFQAFLIQNNFHLLDKSEVSNCIIEDTPFNFYLPEWNFASQFLTALKNMNVVRFFEYYEKACRYFDIPKEKTIFAIKELKETQQFAERLHKEEVEKAGFKH